MNWFQILSWFACALNLFAFGVSLRAWRRYDKHYNDLTLLMFQYALKCEELEQAKKKFEEKT